MKKLILTLTTILLLTGCNTETIKVQYPRLEANEEATKISLNEEKDILQFIQLMFPEYEVRPTCDNYWVGIEEGRHNAEENVIYYYDSTLECNGKSGNGWIYVRKGQELLDIDYFHMSKPNPKYNNDSSTDITFLNKPGCYNYIVGDLSDEMEYFFRLTYYSDPRDHNVGDFAQISDYCPNAANFDNEYEQFANYVYDSFSLIDHSNEKIDER